MTEKQIIELPAAAVQEELTDSAQNLLELVKQLIKEQQFEGVELLFTNATEVERNLSYLREAGMELLHEVCLEHLTAYNHDNNAALYNCVEELLKIIAAHAPAEELLLELLELVEEQKCEFLFTSAMRSLQTVLLRLGVDKPRALEWSLNSIQSRLELLELPAYLSEGYDEKQRHLLEQNEQIQALIMHYITVRLFYEPLLKNITYTETHSNGAVFRDHGINRRNVMCCFLLQNLGKPLALLDLSLCSDSGSDNKTNTYTIQCARNLTNDITHCIGDPYYLLTLVEQRVRWKRRLDAAKEVHELSASNIFLLEEKLPLHALAIYFYMLLVEEVHLPLSIPKVYAPLFVFEAGLYLVTELLRHEEPPLHYRAMLLAKRLLRNLYNLEISAVSLELDVHKDFCHALCNIVGYSSQTHLRQLGVPLLRQYILQFDNEGKYLVLKNLMRTITHTGILGYLAVLYKDVVGSALSSLNDNNVAKLPASFTGQDFRSIFLENICQLPQGTETDLMEHADKLISSLNVIRFFATKDCQNHTGFWHFIADIERNFFSPLRHGLYISIAHYKAELERVENGLDIVDDDAEQLLDIHVGNANSEDDKIDLDLNRQRKLEILNQNLCTFDLMRSLLACATESIELKSKICKTKGGG